MTSSGTSTAVTAAFPVPLQLRTRYLVMLPMRYLRKLIMKMLIAQSEVCFNEMITKELLCTGRQRPLRLPALGVCWWGASVARPWE